MEKIDVLAVMDKALACRDIRVSWPGESVEELAIARAAVAELVEAARDYTWVIENAYGITQTAPALGRLRSALAKFGGAK